VEFPGGLGPVPITVAAVPMGAGGIAIEPPTTTNLSTRVSIEAGAGVAIAGSIISGSSPKQVLIRGLGASLSNFGIVNPLQDPTLDLHDSTGNRLPLTTIGRPRQVRTKFQSPSSPPIRTNQRSWPLCCLGALPQSCAERTVAVASA
jgi:hypothetical protein